MWPQGLPLHLSHCGCVADEHVWGVLAAMLVCCSRHSTSVMSAWLVCLLPLVVNAGGFSGAQLVHKRLATRWAVVHTHKVVRKCAVPASLQFVGYARLSTIGTCCVFGGVFPARLQVGSCALSTKSTHSVASNVGWYFGARASVLRFGHKACSCGCVWCTGACILW